MLQNLQNNVKIWTILDFRMFWVNVLFYFENGRFLSKTGWLFRLELFTLSNLRKFRQNCIKIYKSYIFLGSIWKIFWQNSADISWKKPTV